MTSPLSLSDLDKKLSEKIYRQNYGKKGKIEGVEMIPLAKHLAEDGDFAELIRLTDQGELEQVPGFKLAQVNRTKLNPGSLKAWHLHLAQDEIWYLIPSGLLFVGLWDLRKNSSMNGLTMRAVLGRGKSALWLIPRGVAHGSANFTTQAVDLLYFVENKFNKDNPDEYRLPWDSIGAHFWTPEKD